MGYKENQLNSNVGEIDKSSKMVKELGQRWKKTKFEIELTNQNIFYHPHHQVKQ